MGPTLHPTSPPPASLLCPEQERGRHLEAGKRETASLESCVFFFVILRVSHGFPLEKKQHTVCARGWFELLMCVNIF